MKKKRVFEDDSYFTESSTITVFGFMYHKLRSDIYATEVTFRGDCNIVFKILLNQRNKFYEITGIRWNDTILAR